MVNNQQVKIFDTTLRDGQQCPGAGMSLANNIKFAHLAKDLGIDVLEAGFPSASKLDFTIVNTIAQELSEFKNSPVILGLCQLRESQIDQTIQAVLPAVKNKKAGLHVYLPVDPILLEASLGEKAKDKTNLLKEVYNYIKKTVQAGVIVEFSPEGYSRMLDQFDFTTDTIRAAIDAGATIINCPDTIGGSHWLQGEDYFVNKINRHAEIISKEYPKHDITWSCHCHNDMGTAVENSINAVFKGPVRQIECTVNGVGERAGNASLEQVVMLIKQFSKYHNSQNPLFTNINIAKLQEVSDFISQHMLARQAHWPITGDNAARHTSGGHVNAILKNPLVYQPFDPKEIGKDLSFVFGPLSGGNHAKEVIEKYGYTCADNEKAEIAQFIKDYYFDRRKGITDQELILAYKEYRKPMKIDDFAYSKSKNKAGVYLTGKFFNKTKLDESHEGKDSALAALKISIDQEFPGYKLETYKSIADTQGIDSNSVSVITISDGNNIFTGEGVDGDIEISAMKALINAFNNAYIETKYH